MMRLNQYITKQIYSLQVIKTGLYILIFESVLVLQPVTNYKKNMGRLYENCLKAHVNHIVVVEAPRLS